MSTVKFASLNTLGAYLSELDKRYSTNESLDSYSLKKLETAADGCLASYRLFKNYSPIGDTINIPKDYLVKSGEIKTCTTDDNPVYGYRAGDKYIDFEINTAARNGNTSHMYLLVTELVDVYTGGSGIYIDGSNVVSIKLETANGLSLSENGLSLAAATTTTAGAMSAADKVKLNKCTTTDDFEEITAAEITELFE